MTAVSRRAFVEFWERNGRARLGYLPARTEAGRVHIVVTRGAVVGRALCELSKPGAPFEPAALEAAEKPCAACFNRAREVVFAMRRKEEECPGSL